MQLYVRIHPGDYRRLRDSLLKLPTNLRKMSKDKAHVLGVIILQKARDGAPVFERHLADWLYTQIYRYGNVYRVRIVSDLYYSLFMERGFRPHFVNVMNKERTAPIYGREKLYRWCLTHLDSVPRTLYVGRGFLLRYGNRGARFMENAAIEGAAKFNELYDKETSAALRMSFASMRS